MKKDEIEEETLMEKAEKNRNKSSFQKSLFVKVNRIRDLIWMKKMLLDSKSDVLNFQKTWQDEKFGIVENREKLMELK